MAIGRPAFYTKRKDRRDEDWVISLEVDYTHSAIVQADQVIEFAFIAPVFSEAEFEATMEQIDMCQRRLRSIFVVGLGEPNMPREWKIDGLVWRQWNMALDRARAKLEQRYRAAKFFAGQRRADKKRADAEKALQNVWINVKPDEAIALKKKGFDVRFIGVGWQYTTQNPRAMSKKPRTSIA